MTSEHGQRPTGLFLFSAESIGWASLFVNSFLGLALMLWNAIWLRRWAMCMVLVVLISGGIVWLLKHFTPHPAWFLGNLILAFCLRQHARHQFGLDYFRSLFDGGKSISVVPIISVMSAIQILALGQMVSKLWLADIDPVRHPRAAVHTSGQATGKPDAASKAVTTAPQQAPMMGHHVQGLHTVDFRDVPEAKAEQLVKALVDLGYFSPSTPGWAALDKTPQGLRVTLRMAQGQSPNEALDQQYQKTCRAVDTALGTNGEMWFEVYTFDQRSARRYLPSARPR